MSCAVERGRSVSARLAAGAGLGGPLPEPAPLCVPTFCPFTLLLLPLRSRVLLLPSHTQNPSSSLSSLSPMVCRAQPSISSVNGVGLRVRSQREGGLLRPVRLAAGTSQSPVSNGSNPAPAPGSRASSRRRRSVRRLCSPPGGSAVSYMCFKGLEKREKSKEEHESEMLWARCGRSVPDLHKSSIPTDASVRGKGEGAALRGAGADAQAGAPCAGPAPAGAPPRGQGGLADPEPLLSHLEKKRVDVWSREPSC